MSTTLLSTIFYDNVREIIEGYLWAFDMKEDYEKVREEFNLEVDARIDLGTGPYGRFIKKIRNDTRLFHADIISFMYIRPFSDRIHVKSRHKYNSRGGITTHEKLDSSCLKSLEYLI